MSESGIKFGGVEGFQADLERGALKQVSATAAAHKIRIECARCTTSEDLVRKAGLPVDPEFCLNAVKVVLAVGFESDLVGHPDGLSATLVSSIAFAIDKVAKMHGGLRIHEDGVERCEYDFLPSNIPDSTRNIRVAVSYWFDPDWKPIERNPAPNDLAEFVSWIRELKEEYSTRIQNCAELINYPSQTRFIKLPWWLKSTYISLELLNCLFSVAVEDFHPEVQSYKRLEKSLVEIGREFQTLLAQYIQIRFQTNYDNILNIVVTALQGFETKEELLEFYQALMQNLEFDKDLCHVAILFFTKPESLTYESLIRANNQLCRLIEGSKK